MSLKLAASSAYHGSLSSLLRVYTATTVLHRSTIHISAFSRPEPNIQVKSSLFDGFSSDTTVLESKFSVLGSSSSLLFVNLAPHLDLYFRRGCLIGLLGDPSKVKSRLSLLEPFTRAITGIPFLYQKISSQTSVSALIATKCRTSSFSILHLDGRFDWIIFQRAALLAWAGDHITLKPRINYRRGLCHWGKTLVTGRGKVALTGVGQIYQVEIKSGETYIARASHILAYQVGVTSPESYYMKMWSDTYRLPFLFQWIRKSSWLRQLEAKPGWQKFVKYFNILRQLFLRALVGDRNYFRFTGPTTILLQSRGSAMLPEMKLSETNIVNYTVLDQSMNKLSNSASDQSAVVKLSKDGPCSKKLAAGTHAGDEAKPEQVSRQSGEFFHHACVMPDGNVKFT